MTLLAALVLATFTFTSCGKDDEPVVTPPSYELRTVGFEDATLPAAGYEVKDGNAYSENGLGFSYFYSESEYEGFTYVFWNGFTVSNNTDKTTPGAANQYSVYSTGGADGSTQFAVCFEDGASEMSFAEGQVYEIEHAYIANSTYVYLAVREGKDGYKNETQFSDGDWFLLTITGYDAAGTKTGEKEVFLADYSDGKSFVMSDWTKEDLASLGKVNKVVFALSSSDNNDWGMNTPAYFCIDNITYRYVTE